MKRFLPNTQLLLSLLFVVISIQLKAQWVIYTADVLPNTAGQSFTAFSASSSAGNPTNEIINDPAIEGNKLLHMATDNNFYWRQNNLAAPSPEAATIVVRAKGLGDSKDMVFEMDLDFGTSGTAARQRVIILSNGNWRGDGSSFGSGSTGVDVLDWNIYRFTKSGNEVILYINENPDPVFVKTTTTGNVGNNHFRIGDGWNSATNVMGAHIDWIVWDVSGAYSPTEAALPDGLTGVSTELSSEKEITSFTLTNTQIGEASINSENGTITVSVPDTEDLTSVTPVIFTVSDEASVDPAVDVARDFSDPENPVVYTVIAEDASQKQWTIFVNRVNLNEELIVYEAEAAQFTGSISTIHEGYTASGYIDFLSSGDNSVIFTVCQLEAGVRTAKFRYALGEEHARNARLYVNDVFVSTVEFLPTDSYTDWKETAVALTLPAGVSSVKLTWEDDGPNLDKLSLGGTLCESYVVEIITTNDGVVNLSPARTGNLYFSGETVTLLAEDKPNLVFVEWSGDLTGTDNPAQVVMDNNRTVTAHFNIVTAYTLDVTVAGTGSVTLNPPGGVYAEGTTVTLTANAVLGTSFDGWSGDLTGNASPETITMTSNKTVMATFTGTGVNVDFETPIGFASVVTGSGTYNHTTATFFGPTTGGQDASDTLWINGPADFDKFAKHLYDRMRAYKNSSQKWSSNAAKAPLVIVLKEGVYPAGTSEEGSVWGNHMMTIQEQGDLTIIGKGNVVLNWGFNVKRSWNILFRNLSFQDYYDDAINIGEPETHHIWVDHCTFGHPTTRPSDQSHPDGGVDVKGGASYVTISWSKFRNSWKTNLIGHSDNNGSEDLGKLKVTLYGNHYVNSNSRNPRVRFGEVHVLNNLMEGLTLYGIAASNQSQVYVENNFYLNTRWPMYADRSSTDFKDVYGNNTDGVFTSKTGNYACTALKAVGNAYDDSGLPVITAQISPAMLNPGGRSVKFDEHNAENIFNPASYYSYTAYDASVVRTLIPLFAGAQVVDFFGEATDGMITVTGTLSPFEQTSVDASESQSYSVSATGITGNLTITPPANFEVSINQTDWFTNTTPLDIASADGAVESTVIYVRLNASSSGSYSGNITHTASGASPVLKEVTGNAETGTVPVGTWTIYEADQMPNQFSPAFVASQQSGVFSNAIVPDPDKEGNNLLRMTTTDNGDATNDNNQWRQNVTSGLQDITVVIKAKGIDSEKDLVFDIDLDHGGFRWSMRIRSNGTYSMAVPSGSSGALGINPLEWNTYRFSKAGNNVSVYLNESTTPFFTGTANSGTQSYFRFGDGWGADAGVMKTMSTDIDWVSWDVTGAYSPAETSLPAHLVGGEVTPPAPAIAAVGVLQDFSQIIGSPSDVQTYTVTGSNLTDNLTITPPAGYEVSADDGETWFNESLALVLNHTDGTVSSTTIQVRLNANEEGTLSGNIVHTSTDAETVNVAVTGMAELPPVVPTITLTGTLASFGQIVGAPSLVKTYSVSGLSLTNDITITSPEPFEISIDGTTWVNHSSSITLQQSNGTIENATISVRLNAETTGSYSGDIVHTSSGAVTQTLEVNGTTIDPPNTGTWTVYHANELPDEFVLSPFVISGATAGQSTDGVNTILSDSEDEGNNLLKMLVPASNEALTSFQWRQNLEAEELTVIFRVKGEPGRAIALDVDMDFAGKRSRITLRTDDKRAQVRNGSGGTGTVTMSDITMTEWNTFRFTRTNSETKLYVNESSTPILNSIPATAGANNYFRFGDGDNGATMGGIIDWVSWDVTGAYSPDQKSLPAILGGTDPASLISVVGTLQSFSQSVGSPSAVQTYTVSGTDLTDNITVTPPANYEVSSDGGTAWFTNSSPLVLNHTSGTVTSTTISVRLNASSAGSHSGSIAHTSAGATTVSVAVSGSTTATPTINVTGTLTAFAQEVGSPSAVQTYTVSATNLTGNITITPPVNFEVSSNGGTTWQTNATTLTLVPTDGTVAATIISVRLNATAGGTFSGNITHASTGATTANVAVTGEATVITSLRENPDLKFTMSPNPAMDKLTITRDDPGASAVIAIYTVTGINVGTFEIQAGLESLTMDVSTFSRGLYFVEYLTGKGKRTLRLVKM